MLFRSPWRKIEDIGEYAETLGFEEESYLDLFQAVMELDKKYRVPVLLFYYERYSATVLRDGVDFVIKNTGKNGQYQTISRKGKIKKLSEGGVKI